MFYFVLCFIFVNFVEVYNFIILIYFLKLVGKHVFILLINSQFYKKDFYIKKKKSLNDKIIFIFL